MGGLGAWLLAASILLWGRALADLTLKEFLEERSDDAHLELRSDAPAVLDAPVTIYATLKNKDPGDGPFYFSFSDDAFPMQRKEVKVDGLTANFTLVYPSDTYRDWEYTMTVRVYAFVVFFKTEIARGSVSYRITRTLNGVLVAEQANGTVVWDHHRATVQTKVDTELKAKLHDPEGFLSNSTKSYYWFINGTNYGSTNGSSFNYAFGNPGTSELEALVLASVPGMGPDDEDDAFHDEIATSRSTAQAMNVEIPGNVKMGLLKLRVTARNPMTKVLVNGDKWLKHGKLLNLTVTCDGTGPWSYCWKIVDSAYNSTGNETCGSDFTVLRTECRFDVVWYFRRAGASAVLTIVDNVLNHTVKQVGINVYDVPHRTPVSLIVIPLCSALIAVIACISGVFVFMTFKRNMTGLETADFDFSCPDEQLEYKTFWERLRDSMLNALGNANKDDVSHISSVSSRSVQGPPVGIHYGSIT